MSHSIFVRYFLMTTAILLVCFIVLGVVVIYSFSNYWLNEKQELMTENAVSISELLVQGEYFQSVDIGIRTVYTIDPAMGAALSLFSDSIGADIFITDNRGKVLICSEGINCKHFEQNIPTEIMHKVLENSQGQTYYEIGTFDGFYDSQYYTAATPIMLNGVTVASIFVSSSAQNFERSTLDVAKIFLIGSLAVLAFSFIITYLVTYQMVKPLRQMAYAAHRFGEGDFSYKVKVKGKDEMAALAHAFNSMALSLSASESMRRSFVANVSHELKTPMTVIAGYIDGILDGTIPKEKHEYYLQTVSDEVKRLSRLVRTMLDLSRLEAGEMKINPVKFDLSETVFRIMLSFEQRIEEKEIEIIGLDSIEHSTVCADADMIHQTVYNLMDNAIKFVNKNGYIEIKIHEENGRVYCSIKNSGMGIPANELPHIFDRFYKTDKSRSLDKKGVGLGLYIVNMFISLHGGQIYVSSVEEEYTCFEFWIPKEFIGADKPLPPTR